MSLAQNPVKNKAERLAPKSKRKQRDVSSISAPINRRSKAQKSQAGKTAQAVKYNSQKASTVEVKKTGKTTSEYFRPTFNLIYAEPKQNPKTRQQARRTQKPVPTHVETNDWQGLINATDFTRGKLNSKEYEQAVHSSHDFGAPEEFNFVASAKAKEAMLKRERPARRSPKNQAQVAIERDKATNKEPDKESISNQKNTKETLIAEVKAKAKLQVQSKAHVNSYEKLLAKAYRAKKKEEKNNEQKLKQTKKSEQTKNTKPTQSTLSLKSVSKQQTAGVQSKGKLTAKIKQSETKNTSKLKATKLTAKQGKKAEPTVNKLSFLANTKTKVAGVAIFLLLIVAGFFVLNKVLQPTVLGSEIYLEQISLGNLDQEEFTKTLSKVEADILKQFPLKLSTPNQDVQVDLADLGVELDFAAMFEQAKNQDEKRREQHKKGWFDNSPTTPLPAISLGYVFTLDEQKFKQNLPKLHKKLDSKLQEAEIKGFDIKKLAFDISPSSSEFKLSDSELKQKLETLIHGGMKEQTIELAKGEGKKPKVTKEVLASKVGLVSEAFTKLPYWQESRNQNLRRASEILNGYMLKPGEEFSYNTALGPQDEEHGFALGYADYNGVPILEIGGGLCQISTTLFQAVAKADLEIVERHTHGKMVSYTHHGMDAMVADWADFKFKNNKDYPVAISANFDETEGIITYKIYGQLLPDNLHIELESEKIDDIKASDVVEYVSNKDMAPGEEEVLRDKIDGSEWRTYKIYYDKDNNEVKRESFLYSNYEAYTKKVQVKDASLYQTVTTTNKDNHQNNDEDNYPGIDQVTADSDSHNTADDDKN